MINILSKMAKNDPKICSRSNITDITKNYYLAILFSALRKTDCKDTKKISHLQANAGFLFVQVSESATRAMLLWHS